MNDHVSKPIDPILLFETLERFYRPAARPLPAASPAGEAAPKAPLPPAPEDLPSVEGLDTKDGLNRVAGNRKLYLKLLRQFVEQQGPAAAQIAEALARQDTSLAERLAHTVKGVAGNLGARRLQQAAGALEKIVKTNPGGVEQDPAWAEFRSTLEDFVNRLRAALPWPDAAPPAAAPAVALDPVQAKPVVSEMLGHLGSFDPAAGDCLETHRAVFQSVLPAEAFAQFEQQVAGFAFADALALLETAARAKGLMPS